MFLKKKFFKGIMFHYFHDNQFFKKSPGSLSSKRLIKIIRKIGKKNILDPLEFIEKIKNKSIKPYHVCFTFDDALKSQYKIALPVLKKFDIKSFFFITTSILTKKPNLSEIYRFFRDNCFKNLNSYYSHFYKELYRSYSEKKINYFLKKNRVKIKKKNKIYSFYSLNDIKFREIRDHFLNNNDYDKIMKRMFKKKRFNYKKKIKQLYLSKNEIKSISKNGHLIGLHSHMHPNIISNLSYNKQKQEFNTNKKILEKITNKKVISASYPRGDYNVNTIKVLKHLGIRIAFRDNSIKLEKKYINKNLEVPRVDHNRI